MLDKIKGEIKVFKFDNKSNKGEDYITYSTQLCSNKIKDSDKYLNYFANVLFSKEVLEKVPKDKKSFDVMIEEAWLKPEKVKETVKVALFINKCKFII